MLKRRHNLGMSVTKKSLTPNEQRSLKEMAREFAPEALMALKRIMEDEGTPHAARVSAADKILDRAYGKPAQAVQLTGDEGGPIEVTWLS